MQFLVHAKKLCFFIMLGFYSNKIDRFSIYHMARSVRQKYCTKTLVSGARVPSAFKGSLHLVDSLYKLIRNLAHHHHNPMLSKY